MRYNDFYQFLRKVNTDRTAKEIAGMCRTIEREFGVDLDNVIASSDRDTLRKNVSGMTQKSVYKYRQYLEKYFDFADLHSPVITGIPFSSTTKPSTPDLCHCVPISCLFYKLEDDPLPDIYREILLELESNYECIMGFGRELLGHIDSLKRIERIPVILSPYVKQKTYTADDKWLSKKIAEYFRKCQGNVSEQVILEILQNKTFTDTILGEFCRGDREFGPYIVLYYNVIGGETDQERNANFAQVLAHEYMHYMEYVYCSAKGVKDYSNEFLSEAMSDFFGVLYSIKLHDTESLKVAHARYNGWKKYFYTCWPYAETLHFYSIDSIEMEYSDIYTDYVNHGSVEKLIKVFSECHDVKKAYKTLKAR